MDELRVAPAPASTSDIPTEVPFEILSKPSNVIKTFRKTIIVADVSYELILITMKRSFLLVINNVNMELGDFPAPREDQDGKMSPDRLVQSFMGANSSLKGLSLAIGGHSTCLLASEHSVASLTLASRLSKSLNGDGPVYVANNIQTPSDTVDTLENMTSLYEKLFQFVRLNYSRSH